MPKLKTLAPMNPTDLLYIKHLARQPFNKVKHRKKILSGTMTQEAASRVCLFGGCRYSFILKKPLDTVIAKRAH